MAVTTESITLGDLTFDVRVAGTSGEGVIEDAHPKRGSLYQDKACP